jgi:hypothetical protein
MTETNELKPEALNLNVSGVVGALSNWKTYVIYLLLAVSLGEGVVILWQRGTNSHAKTELVKKDREIDMLKVARDLANANLATCQLNVEDQNRRIAAFGDDYKNLNKQFNDLDTFIRTGIKNGTFYRKADEVRNQVTPKSCDETLDFLNRNTK